jgi:hypothetical protein
MGISVMAPIGVGRILGNSRTNRRSLPRGIRPGRDGCRINSCGQSGGPACGCELARHASGAHRQRHAANLWNGLISQRARVADDHITCIERRVSHILLEAGALRGAAITADQILSGLGAAFCPVTQALANVIGRGQSRHITQPLGDSRNDLQRARRNVLGYALQADRRDVGIQHAAW